MSGDPRYLELLREMADLHARKAAGYGTDGGDVWANFREAERWGITTLQGCLVRMGDKYRRAQSVLRDPGNEQVGETARDTLIDLAAYALIAVCLLMEERRL